MRMTNERDYELENGPFILKLKKKIIVSETHRTISKSQTMYNHNPKGERRQNRKICGQVLYFLTWVWTILYVFVNIQQITYLKLSKYAQNSKIP